MNSLVDKQYKIFIIAGILVVVLRIPAFFFGFDTDTGILSVCGLMIEHGNKMYSQIWDNKTPGMYYMFAMLIRFFGADCNIFIAVGIINLFLLSVSVYFLTRQLFCKKSAAYSLFIFIIAAAYPVYSLDGLDTEYFFLLFIVLGSIYTLKGYKGDNKYCFLIGGLLFGLSFVFKQLAFWNIFAVGVFALFKSFQLKKPFIVWKNVSALFLLISCVIAVQAVWIFYFYSIGDLNSMVYAVFKYNTFSYVGDRNFLAILFSKDGMFWIFRAIIGVWPIWVLGLVYIFLSIKNFFSESILFVNLMIFSSVAAICTSGRFFGHYFLQIIPWLSIYSACTVTLILNTFTISRRSCCRKKAILLCVIIMCCFLYVLSWGYYINKYAGDNPYYRTKHLISYLNDNMSENDTLYMWGNPVSTYFLLNRVPLTKYTFMPVGKIHPNPCKEVISEIIEKEPDFIVKSSEKRDIPDIQLLINRSYKKIYSYSVKPFSSRSTGTMVIYKLKAGAH